MNKNKVELSGAPSRAEANRRRALQHYIEWQGRDLPSLPYEVCLYLADCYGRIDRRRMDLALSALGYWHKENDFPDPTACPSVIDLVCQLWDRMPLRRKPPFQRPPSIVDVMHLVEAHERCFSPRTPPDLDPRGNSLKSIYRSELIAYRNRAILLIGFWFGMTTAEVCRLMRHDVKITSSSLEITSNRIGESGRRRRNTFQIVRLPLLCPLAALEDWLACVGNSSHYLFPRTTRKALPGPVSSRSVQVSFNKLMAANNGPPFRMPSLRYSLYFFLADNGWSRQKILAHVPFYKKQASKTRIINTRRDGRIDLLAFSSEDISNITSIVESSCYQAA